MPAVEFTTEDLAALHAHPRTLDDQIPSPDP